MEPLELATHQALVEGFPPSALVAPPIILDSDKPLELVRDALSARADASSSPAIFLRNAKVDRWAGEVHVSSVAVLFAKLPAASDSPVLSSVLLDDTYNCPVSPVAVLPDVASTSVKDVLRVFCNESLRQVYIVDAMDRLKVVRTISRSEILRFIIRDPYPEALRDPLSVLEPETAPTFCFEDELLVSALHLMSVIQVTTLPVLRHDDLSLVGEISYAQLDRMGLSKTMTSLRSPLSGLVGGKNSNRNLHVSPATSFFEAAGIMAKEDSDYVCVVEGGTKFVRLVSLQDVLEHLTVHQ